MFWAQLAMLILIERTFPSASSPLARACEVLSYLYIPSSFQLFLSLFLLVIQLFAKEVVLDQIGTIKGPDPWKCHTSRCHLGYIYTGECVSPYYGMGANCMDVRQFVGR